MFEPGSLSCLNLLCSTGWAHFVAMDVDWVCLAAVGFFLICQKGEVFAHASHRKICLSSSKRGNMIEYDRINNSCFDDRQEAQIINSKCTQQRSQARVQDQVQ